MRKQIEADRRATRQRTAPPTAAPSSESGAAATVGAEQRDSSSTSGTSGTSDTSGSVEVQVRFSNGVAPLRTTLACSDRVHKLLTTAQQHANLQPQSFILILNRPRKVRNCLLHVCRCHQRAPHGGLSCARALLCVCVS